MWDKLTIHPQPMIPILKHIFLLALAVQINMEIQKINETNRDKYWNFISQNPITYFFEIRDFRLNYESSNFWIFKQIIFFTTLFLKTIGHAS